MDDSSNSPSVHVTRSTLRHTFQRLIHGSPDEENILRDFDQLLYANDEKDEREEVVSADESDTNSVSSDVIDRVRPVFTRVLTDSSFDMAKSFSSDDLLSSPRSRRHRYRSSRGPPPLENHDTDSDVSDMLPTTDHIFDREEAVVDQSGCGKFCRLIQKVAPITSWLPNYKRTDFFGDFLAGLTLGVFGIPQGIAYAIIADLPPIYGLYSSIIPAVMYALMGSSGQLSVGPVAVVSLLNAEAISALGASTEEEKITLSITLCFLSGIMQLVMGFLRFGFIVNFLSHSVISGFTAGSAVIILTSQLKHIFGISPAGGTYWWQDVYYIAKELPSTKLFTFLFSLGTVALVYFVRRLPSWLPKDSVFRKILRFLPYALVSVFFGTLIAYLARLSERIELSIVGRIPGGFPAPSFPQSSWSEYGKLALPAFTIAIISFTESYAIAKRYALKHGYEVSSNGELLANGAGNVIGSFFQSYTVAGSFSRSAVNDETGARTPLAGFITAMITIIFLFLFLGVQLLYHLPKATLAVIIIVSVLRLIDIKEIKNMYYANKRDFFILMTSLVGTLVLGVEFGLAIAVAFSIFQVVQRISKPHYAVLGRLPHSHVYRSVKRFPEAVQEPGILIFRYDSSIFFGNVEHFKDRIRKFVRTAPTRIYVILFDFSSVSDIDLSGIHGVEELVHEFSDDGIVCYFSVLKGPVREVIGRTHLDALLPSAHRFMTLLDGVHAARDYIRSILEDQFSSSQNDLEENTMV